jgi:hypothetical protein
VSPDSNHEFRSYLFLKIWPAPRAIAHPLPFLRSTKLKVHNHRDDDDDGHHRSGSSRLTPSRKLPRARTLSIIS